MKTEKNIAFAFVLNLAFSVFEFIGGIVTGSVAILSDAIHDLGDAASIGFACYLEHRSKRPPDHTHTYGYVRYSVLGGAMTTMILLLGSAMVMGNAVHRLFSPVEIHYDGMILFAIVGVVMNLLAAYLTREGDSINQKAVNLHMLEDVLGWVVVLVGAVVMRFTDLSILDPLMSIGVALFIFLSAAKHFKSILDLFLEKTPENICIEELAQHIAQIKGILDVHHIHVRSMDGQLHVASMHIVTDEDAYAVKERVRSELREHGIMHATLELESPDEPCHEKHCPMETLAASGHHHHHHHHEHHH